VSQFHADPVFSAELERSGGGLVASTGQGTATPALFAGSPHAARRFWEFFTAEIPNDNTRKAYFCAIRRFDAWCVFRNLDLLQLQPILIAAYIKNLQASLSIPSVKQHLAAIRMLFDYLVVGQVLPMNPESTKKPGVEPDVRPPIQPRRALPRWAGNLDTTVGRCPPVSRPIRPSGFEEASGRRAGSIASAVA